MKNEKIIVCKRCGTINPAKSKFCQSCGSKLSPSIARKILKLILTIIAVLFILFFGLIVWVFLDVKKDGKQQMNPEYSKAIEKDTTKIQEDYKQNNENSSSKTELSESERAEKEQILKEKLSKLKLIHDDFSETDVYFSTNTPGDKQHWKSDVKTFISPFIVKKGNEYVLCIVSNYYGDDWLFIDHVTVKIDGEFYEPYPKPMNPNFERDTCYGGYVSEHCMNFVKYLNNTVVDSQYYDILKKMVDGKNVVVRFSGSKGTKDLIIDKDKQAIREVLEAWDIIEELYGK